ncbi:unnamed protein product [Linum tenue]|uniref:Uncharacterized protein n=1 Tax=Linum tenue TaxID=586396 RepID=A0AAV0K150_9ROSI|nr:unnamed protein product [Linum tenue]
MATADTKKKLKTQKRTSSTRKKRMNPNPNRGCELHNRQSECNGQSWRASSSGCRRRACHFESTMC